MYKYLLCWRYLKTRYIALASVISVMLGVATMIVVNSVMAGFGEKMRDRLHGVLADVVVECVSLDGFYNSEEVMARVKRDRRRPGDRPGPDHGNPRHPPLPLSRRPGHHQDPSNIIGVRPEDRAKTGDFGEFLVDEKNQKIAPSFEVDDKFKQQTPAGELLKELPRRLERSDRPGDDAKSSRSKCDEQAPDEGTILGYAIATHHRGKNLPDHFIAPPGTKVGLLFPVAGKVKSEGGIRHVHRRRLLQERHERIRFDARLCSARTVARTAQAD